jgi:chaperonin cofactor prefoldin
MEAQEIIERIQAMVERRNFVLNSIDDVYREIEQLDENYMTYGVGSMRDVDELVVVLGYLKNSVAMWDISIEFEMKQLHREHKSVLEALGVS